VWWGCFLILASGWAGFWARMIAIVPGGADTRVARRHSPSIATSRNLGVYGLIRKWKSLCHLPFPRPFSSLSSLAGNGLGQRLSQRPSPNRAMKTSSKSYAKQPLFATIFRFFLSEKARSCSCLGDLPSDNCALLLLQYSYLSPDGRESDPDSLILGIVS
jgi:hypothetical protein